MTTLTIIQTAATTLGLPRPSAAVSASDSTTVQMVALLNEEANILSRRHDWQSLVREATFTTVATESQGAISTLAPGLRHIIGDTIWNRTTDQDVAWPVTPKRWQADLTLGVTSAPWSSFRIRGGSLLMYPAPTAGQTAAFEYVSGLPVIDQDAGTDKATYTKDGDTSSLDEMALALGVVWRWKQQKGFDISADYQQYEALVRDLKAKDSPAGLLSFGAPVARRDNIPLGNW